MQNITLIGIDLGKHTFHIHCRVGSLTAAACHGLQLPL